MRKDDFDVLSRIAGLLIAICIGVALGVNLQEPDDGDYRCPNCRRVLHVAR